MTIKISQLTALSSITNTTIIPVVDTAGAYTTKRIDGQTLKNFFSNIANSGVSSDLTVNSNLIPTVDTVFDLGSASYQYNNVYVGGIITHTSAIRNNSNIQSVSTATGAITISGGGGLGVTGNVYASLVAANYFTGELSTGDQPSITTLGGVTSIGASNSTEVTGTLLTAAQPNVTSVGTLTSLAVSGNVTTGNIAGTFLTGTLLTAAQSRITSVGTLTSLAVTGNITAGNLSATSLTGTLATTAQNSIINANALVTVGNLTTLSVAGVTTKFGNLNIRATTAATSTTTGALTVAGGVGVSGNVVAPYFVGNIVGNLIGTVATTITTVGTLTSGVWQGSTIGVAYGGTGTTTSTGTGNVVLSNSPTLVSPALGTPASGNFSSGTFTWPTFNQNTTGTAAGLSATLAVASGGTGVTTSTGTGSVVLSTSPVFVTQISTPSIAHTGTSGVGDIGASGAAFGVVWAKATSAQYADLAENYLADAAYEPGTVVEFGGNYEVTLASDETKRVAGVVSTNPAYLMNTQLTGSHVVAIALQGRVPVKVRGTIRKGDMLISGGDGYARPTNEPKFGTVIGKALENFDGTTGVIEVVVGRL